MQSNNYNVMHNGKIRLDNLQALRGIAALLVVICHSVGNFVTWKNWQLSSESLIDYFGELGVWMFFVISGFIICHIHSKDFCKPKATLFFYYKRFTRIIPLYWIFTLIVAIKIYIQGRDGGLFEIVKSLLFIPYQNESGLWRPVHQLGWTLNYEVYFYFVFGLMLNFSKTIGLGFLFLFILAPVLLNSYLKLNIFYGDPVVLYFLFGVIIFIIKEKKLININLSGLTFVLGSILLIGCVLIINKYSELQLIFLALALPLVAVASLSKSSAPKIAVYIGNISYSLYLVHTLVIGGVLIFFKKVDKFAQGDIGLLMYVGLSLVLSVIAAYISYIFLEKPILNKFSTLRKLE